MDSVSKPPSTSTIYLFAGLGVLLIIISLGLGWWTRQTTATAVRAEGTVIRLVQSEDSNSRRAINQDIRDGGSINLTLTPEIDYQVNGKTYRIRGKVSSAMPSYAVGDKVTVLYPPDRPAEGRIDSFMETWFLPLIIGVFGAVCTLVAIGMWTTRRRESLSSSTG